MPPNVYCYYLWVDSIHVREDSCRIRYVVFTHKHKKNENIFQESEITAESESQDEEEATEESAIIGRRHIRNYYSLNEHVELGVITSLYFNKFGQILFYGALCVYLYGDLAIYVAAICDTVVDLACNNSGNTTENFSLPCWEGSETDKMSVYRLSVIIFVALVGPFSYFNVQKTKYLQIITSSMRWSAFLIMIFLATVHMAQGDGASPVAVNFQGMPGLIGASVYSFMCHHSLPGLVAPFAEKRFVRRQLATDYCLICLFYLLLALTGSFAFEDLKNLYTLNFIPSSSEHHNWFIQIIYYFLAAFPIFTLSTSFPIIAITLQNNLKALFLDATYPHRYNFFQRRLAFPTLAIVPPTILAFCTHDLRSLVEYTGAYGGACIQYFIPTFLVFSARKSCKRVFGADMRNKYASPFTSNYWLLFLLLWAVMSTIIVTISINVQPFGKK